MIPRADKPGESLETVTVPRAPCYAAVPPLPWFPANSYHPLPPNMPEGLCPSLLTLSDTCSRTLAGEQPCRNPGWRQSTDTGQLDVLEQGMPELLLDRPG